MRVMHRTQISLKKEQYRLLTQEARRRGVSLSALLRELVDARYANSARRSRPAKGALESIIGIASGSGEAVGRHHNLYLYGRGRR